MLSKTRFVRLLPDGLGDLRRIGSLNCGEQYQSNKPNRQIKNETIFLDLNRALRASGQWSGIINMFQSEKKTLEKFIKT